MTRFILKKKEDIKEGIIRIMMEQINLAIHHAGYIKNKTDKRVHEIRKSFKRLRAVLRLIRDEIGYNKYMEANILFRDLGRSLSLYRDCYTYISTLKKIRHKIPPKELKNYFIILKELKNQKAQLILEFDMDNKIENIINQLKVTNQSIQQIPIVNDDFTVFYGGLKRIYRQSKKLFVETIEQPTDEVIHTWRKRVKYLWHQIQVLENIWPEQLSTWRKILKKISELLGLNHDLTLLHQKIVQLRNSTTIIKTKRIESLILRLRDYYYLQAVHQGQLFFIDSPEQFVKKFNQYYNINY